MPNISIHQFRFYNSEALSKALNTRRQTIVRQLSLKALQCDLLLIESGKINFLFTETSCPLHVTGAKGQECLEFSFILQPGQQDFFAHEQVVSKNTLFGFDPTREADLIVPSKSILCVVQIQRPVFELWAELMQRNDLDMSFFKTNVLSLPNEIAGVHEYLKRLNLMALHQPDSLTHAGSGHVLEDFIPLLIDSIPNAFTPVEAPSRSPRRFNLVKQAVAYMRTHLEAPLTLMSLCKALHTSERPLTYGFREVFGVSPMAHLKALRLQAVRTQLQCADPATAAIVEIANRFGFQSMGHFSRDYKTMFGELPSETLK